MGELSVALWGKSLTYEVYRTGGFYIHDWGGR